MKRHSILNRLGALLLGCVLLTGLLPTLAPAAGAPVTAGAF